MNAVGHQRLAPWLVGACAVTGAALLVFLAGVGRHVTWNDVPVAPEEAAHAARAAVMPQTMPLASFAEVWQRPLFAADRKPGAVAASTDSISLGDLQLTGIILTPTLKMALFRSTSGDKQVRVKEGAALPDGRWTLATLGPRSATFDNGGERKELTLVTARPDALAKAPENAAADGQQPPIAGQPPANVQAGPDNRVIENPPQPPPPNDDPGSEAAQRRARIDALRAAVQRRRAEQQATQQQQVPEGVR
ncbi:general secretion pathway protein GspN [Pinirhizobacter soli]|uniref:general secretion pathway protein GspN n=1 Tax=Pinirhizobacter soli TaxID=2786953 RepID=UPI00202A76EA|nr:general secretion pathway protein GspN [Pinirhizobacter soli]